MRLTAGGCRELHWHTAAEWAIVLYGNARITAVDFDGKSFVADVKKDDLWYFPGGVPHSIQGLDPDGTEFLLVFDDGNFSEAETVLLSDSMMHLPPEVLAKNFNVSAGAFKDLPQHELFIFEAEKPGSLEADIKAASGNRGSSPSDFAFRTMKMPPTKRTKSGEVRIIDSSTFKVAKTVAMAMVTVHPGGMRELPLAPQRLGVAVLYQRQRPDDGCRHRKQSPDDGFSGRRRGLCGKDAAALCREHGRHGSRVPGDVQQQLLSGHFVLGLAGEHAAGVGVIASESRQGHAGGVLEDRGSDCADLSRGRRKEKGQNCLVSLNNRSDPFSKPAMRALPAAVAEAALVEIVDEHLAHVAAGVDQHPLDAVALADFLEPRVESLDGLADSRAAGRRAGPAARRPSSRPTNLIMPAESKRQLVVVHDLEQHHFVPAVAHPLQGGSPARRDR